MYTTGMSNGYSVSIEINDDGSWNGILKRPDGSKSAQKDWTEEEKLQAMQALERELGSVSTHGVNPGCYEPEMRIYTMYGDQTYSKPPDAYTGNTTRKPKSIDNT